MNQVLNANKNVLGNFQNFYPNPNEIDTNYMVTDKDIQWSKKVIGITKNAKNKELIIKITSNFANMISSMRILCI